MPRKVERVFNSQRWTRARFWGFIRSSLRYASRKWQPINDAKTAARRPYRGKGRRQKWEYRCASCGHWFAGKEVEVDHVEPVGSLKDYDDLPGFVRRLFCETDGLRVLCGKCHEERRNSQ